MEMISVDLIGCYEDKSNNTYLRRLLQGLQENAYKVLSRGPSIWEVLINVSSYDPNEN